VGLSALGSLSGLAPDERVYAARFMGDRLYVVTFRQVDPLFVIDLAAPAAPVLLGQLKVPGYSDYLHPINGTHLIGIGKDATDQGLVLGLKLALFDASTPTAPAEAYSLVLGDRGTQSAALDDHKAFSYDAARRLLTLPVSLALTNACGNSEQSWPDTVWQGAVIWRVGETAFQLRGLVPHYEPADAYVNVNRDWSMAAPPPSPPPPPPELGSGAELPMCPRYNLPSCGSSQSTAVKRSIYIGEDALFTVSALMVRADSLAAMANATANATAYTQSEGGAADGEAAAAWQRAFAGSLLAEVPLPHNACKEYVYAYDGAVDMPAFASEFVVRTPSATSSSLERRRLAMVPVPPATEGCTCTCTTTCALPELVQLDAARAALGFYAPAGPESAPPTTASVEMATDG